MNRLAVALLASAAGLGFSWDAASVKTIRAWWMNEPMVAE